MKVQSSVQRQFWLASPLSIFFCLLLSVTATADPFKVMCFNVRVDFEYGAPSSGVNAWISTTGNHRRDLVTSVINDYDPDILGVQEPFNHQVNDIDNGIQGYEFYGVGRNNGRTFGEYSGIYYRDSRFTQVTQGTFWLSNTPQSPSVYPMALQLFE